MATKRKTVKKWDSEQMKRQIEEVVSTIMMEKGHTHLEVMKITRRLGRSKGVIGYHYKNLNELLKIYIQQKDYWPTFLDRFKLSDKPNEAEIKDLFIELMKDNFKKFQIATEMQKIILWQISQESPMLKSVSDQREAEGAKVISLANPFFLNTDVNFNAILGLLLGGSYYMVLHAKTNKSTVCGIDINWDRDRDTVLKTLGQVISWAFEMAKQNQAS